MLGVIDQRHIDVFEVLSRRVVNDPRRTPRPLLLRPGRAQGNSSSELLPIPSALVWR